MAKAFLMISILVTLATAYLGFATKGKVDGMKTDLNTARTAESQARGEASKAKGDLKKSQEDLTKANEQVESQKTQIASLETTVQTAQAEATTAKNAVAAAERRAMEAETKLASAPTATAAPTTDLESPAMVSLREDLAKAQQEVAEAKSIAETLRTREKQSAERLAAANAALENYKKPIRQQGMTGRVVAVNPGWNFVVLDLGDNKGATVNSPLLVMRDGNVVARLRITSVEPSTSIADVIPGSLPRGQYVQPGDRVVFSGRQEAPASTAPSDAAPAQPAPAPATAVQ